MGREIVDGVCGGDGDMGDWGWKRSLIDLGALSVCVAAVLICGGCGRREAVGLIVVATESVDEAREGLYLNPGASPASTLELKEPTLSRLTLPSSSASPRLWLCLPSDAPIPSVVRGVGLTLKNVLPRGV